MKSTTNRHYAYDKKWEELFPITQVKSDKHAYFCVPCDRENSCACNGIRNVQAHCRSLVHMRKVKEQNSRKRCAESVGHISPESSVGPPLAECSHDGIDLNVSVSKRDQYGRFISKSTSYL
ncbi:hypothetical protein RF11_13062 [Thelohanellus kitauei]|uniref:Uncharacterized protein n=1 Tax=Thelohanellus kitauei TaxID=669202 RepID=A0A0C2MRH2_THEKT|nr:hypothetical protein RF11_13062 [Thelohanellus kitauei]